MECGIDRSHITTVVKKVHTIALICHRVASKYAFESTSSEFR